MITADKIKELREISGISLMACRKALEETGGDLEKALEIIKKASADVAARKAERTAKDGAILIKKSGPQTAVVILNCETDFVAKNENFIKLANDLADIALKEGADKAKAGARQLIEAVIQKTGENIQLKDIVIVSGNTGAYVHGGKIGAVVSLNKDNDGLARDLAMHITALKPEYLSFQDIPKDKWQEMTSYYKEEVSKMNKPEAIKDKIVEGKLNEYFKQFTLLEQPFIKDDKSSIKDLLKKENNSVNFFQLYAL